MSEAKATRIDSGEALRRMRIHWLSNIAHDLRGPLFAARGYAKLMLEKPAGPVTVTQRKYLNSIVENINKVSFVVSQLEQFPNGEALDLDVFCLRELLDSAAGKWIGAGPRLVAQLPPEPLYTIGDRAKLADAVHKLLGVTYEFTQPSGLVEMRASHNDGELTVRLCGSRDREAALTPPPPPADLSEPSDVLRLHGGAASFDFIPDRTCHVTFRLPVIR